MSNVPLDIIHSRSIFTHACFIFSCYNVGLLLEELTAFCIIYLNDILIKGFSNRKIECIFEWSEC